MTPNRKLVYGFMNLPHYRQLGILKGFYTPKEFKELKDTDLFIQAFRRAVEWDQWKVLKARIQSALLEAA